MSRICVQNAMCSWFFQVSFNISSCRIASARLIEEKHALVSSCAALGSAPAGHAGTVNTPAFSRHAEVPLLVLMFACYLQSMSVGRMPAVSRPQKFEGFRD